MEQQKLIDELFELFSNKLWHFLGVSGLVLSIVFYILLNNKYKAMKYLIVEMRVKNEKLESKNEKLEGFIHSLEESIVKIEAICEKKF
jgi:uncharacterized protein involved in exopolysaccharide biosynthesis